MKKIRLLLAATIISVVIVPVYGQTADNNGITYTGVHEIDLNMALPSGVSYVKVASAFARNFSGFLYEVFLRPIKNDIEPSVEQGYGKTMLPAFGIGYGYNLKEWLNLGAVANYSYGSWDMLYRDDGQYAWREYAHMTNIAISLTFYWLNREKARLYSGFSVGLSILFSNIGAFDKMTAGQSDILVAPMVDLRLIGVTVGKRLYGRFELGTTYGILRAGIGYRF